MISGLQTCIIREPVAVHALEQEWRALLKQTCNDNIFLSWDWVSAWWQTICPAPDHYVITARDTTNQLVGVAPFHRHPLSLFGVGGYKCLRILGCDRLSGGEYPGFLIRIGAEKEFISAVTDCLYDHKEEWDCAWIPKVGQWQDAYVHFSALADTGRFLTRRVSRQFSAISLPDDIETYEKSVGKNARHHLRRCTRKLLAMPNSGLVVCNENAKLESMLQTHIRLNSQRWYGVSKGGTFRFAKRIEFYRHIAAAGLASGTLGFYGLQVEGQLMALWFGFIVGEIYYSFSLSYDVVFAESTRTGPANVLFGLMLPLLIQLGVREFDHLGGVSEYKLRWGAQSRDGSDILLCANTLKGKILHYSSVWPSGRWIVMETPGELCFDTHD